MRFDWLELGNNIRQPTARGNYYFGGPIVSRTYGTHKTYAFTYFFRQYLVLFTMHLPIFSGNIWSYLLWPPAIIHFFSHGEKGPFIEHPSPLVDPASDCELTLDSMSRR